MAIQFRCECGKPLRADDRLVGKRTRCPHCGRVQEIPPFGAPEAAPETATAHPAPPSPGVPAIDPDLGDGLPYDLAEPAGPPPPAPSWYGKGDWADVPEAGAPASDFVPARGRSRPASER